MSDVKQIREKLARLSHLSSLISHLSSLISDLSSLISHLSSPADRGSPGRSKKSIQRPG